MLHFPTPTRSLAAFLALAPLAAANEVHDDTKLSHTTTNCFALGDNDRFGSAVDAIGDLNGDGFEDIVVGRPDADTTNLNNGAVDILFLDADGECIGSRHIPGGTSGEVNRRFGQSVAGLADLDGDGVQEIAVGEKDGVQILFMDGGGGVVSSTLIDLLGVPDGIGLGDSVRGLPDVNGDGTNDLIIGAPFDDGSGTNAGAAYLVYLKPNGAPDGYSRISGDHQDIHLDGFDNFGDSVALHGDLDGNSFFEVAIGAPGDDDGFASAGAVWIYELGLGKVISKISATSGNMDGLELGDAFGKSVAQIGDYNGDGRADLAVGASGDDDGGVGIGNVGAVHILIMTASSTVLAQTKSSAETSGLSGLDDIDVFGSDMAMIGDLDGDGVEEFAIGASGDDDGGNSRGAVHVLFYGYYPPLVKSHGCQPDGSLSSSGLPIPGETIDVILGNPFGSQNVGSFTFLFFSLSAPAPSCGIPMPGMSMDPNEANGALLINFPTVAVIAGPPFPGVSVFMQFGVPNSSAFLGVDIYLQGAIYDPFPSPGGVQLGLSDGRHYTIGTCN